MPVAGTKRIMAKKKPTVVSIVGARPQFVKLAALASRLKASFHHVIIHSGQHYDYDMSQVFFDQLRLPPPDINLNVGSGPHGRQTARILDRCERALVSNRPDLVLIYGDTNTTLAGALAAAKLEIPIGHVEAGLRSFRLGMPEEINRRVADHLSALLFYPTPTAHKNLLDEGITRGLINAGDVMYEILEACLPLIKNRKPLAGGVDFRDGDYFLITLHRAENVDDPRRLERFVDILDQIDGVKIFPAHPRVVKNLRRLGLLPRIRKIRDLIMTRPQPYLESLALISKARAALTDSGGMQKEAYFLGCPCLTLRSETEWVETVEAGANVLVDLSPSKVARALRHLPRKAPRLTRYRIKGKNPSEVIVEAIAADLGKR